MEVGLVGDRTGFLKVVGEEDSVRSWAGDSETWAGHVSESVGGGGMVDGSGP